MLGNMTVKEMVIAGTAVVGTGLGVVNMVSGIKTKKRVKKLEAATNDINNLAAVMTQAMAQQVQPQTAPTAEAVNEKK